MSKVSRKFKSALVLTCMCSMSFYMGATVIGNTEAKFLNEKKVDSVVSAAIVFPKTIENITKEAQLKELEILKTYQSMMQDAQTSTSVEDMEKVLVNWQQQREKLLLNQQVLQNIYTEVEGYYKQISETVKVGNTKASQEVLAYVQNGFTNIKNIKSNTEQQASIQKIDEMNGLLQTKINEAKQKQQEEQAKQKQQEEQAKQKQQEEQAKQKQQEEQAKQKQQEEQAKQKQQEEQAKQKSEAKATRRTSEAKATRRASEAKATRRTSEAKTARRASEAKATRRTSEIITKN
ncbi:hypothetical protein AZF08_16270 [Bacillus gaemokensis]|uniref:DUF4047 domain-containing protein n=1 Tax=Bacillus gaemokensis TaxID=574375 RepID=UPI0007929ABA|nr:DUF4047 domain-containing protein [Bacillus gaemokensis]KYG26346.1 hypothetical protein AZF08_16270 [Bacillus gaemokensis]